MTDEKRVEKPRRKARDWRTVALALAGVTKTAVDDAIGATHQAHENQMKVMTLYAELETEGADHHVAIELMKSEHHEKMTAMARELASEKKRASDLQEQLSQTRFDQYVDGAGKAVTIDKIDARLKMAIAERDAAIGERDIAIAERDTAIAVQDEAINEQRKEARRSAELVAQLDALFDGLVAIAEQTGDPSDKVKMAQTLNQLMENDGVGLGLEIQFVRSKVHDENKRLREQLRMMEQALDAGTQGVLGQSLRRSVMEHDGLVAQLQLLRGELHDQKTENEKLRDLIDNLFQALEKSEENQDFSLSEWRDWKQSWRR
jgi:uncharacterized protein (DUF3084 family)